MDLEPIDPDATPGWTIPTAAPPTAALQTSPVRSRTRTKVVVAAGVAAAIGAAGFVAGSAAVGTPSVRLTNAAAVQAAANAPSASTPGASTPRVPPATPAGKPGIRRHGMRGTAGKVSAITAGSTPSFTVTAPWGDVHVTTSAATTYSTLATGQVGDAKVGLTVIVSGTATANNSLAANRLFIAPADALMKTKPEGAEDAKPKAGPTTPERPIARRGAVGTVKSNNGSTLTVDTAQGTVTVTTGATTKVIKTVAATAADVKVGTIVAVKGARDTTGVVAATSVSILPLGPNGPLGGLGFGPGGPFGGRGGAGMRGHGGGDDHQGAGGTPAAPAAPAKPAGTTTA